MKQIGLLAVGMWLGIGVCMAQRTADADVVLQPNDIIGYVDLPTQWYFTGTMQPPSDVQALPNLGRLEDIRLPESTPLLVDWDGMGWFSIRIAVDSALVGEHLGLWVRQYGAAEIFLDGTFLHELGTPSHDAALERPVPNPEPRALVLPDTLPHILSVRYSNHATLRLHRFNYDAGFQIQVGSLADMVVDYTQTLRQATLVQFGLMGIYLTYGLLHLFFFVFLPKRRENLYFAIVAFTIAIILFNNFHESLFFRDAEELIFIRRFWGVTVVVHYAFLLFLYRVYEMRIPRHYFVLVAMGVVTAVWAWFYTDLTWSIPEGGRRYAYVVASLLVLEVIRVLAVNTFIHKKKQYTIAVGGFMLALAYAYPLVTLLGLVEPSIDINLVSNFIVTAFVVVVSIHLSRQFAQTNRALQQQLEEVQRLSEQQLEQERQLQREAMERKLLEAEYARKVAELEEARQLQLSMLPEALPQHPQVELAAYMQTATEVGGDYYDFAVDESGVLTLAVGDATGHGMKAGTMVTATKSLFKAFAEDEDMLGVLRRKTHALKQMNLRKLFMALTLARYTDGHLRIVSAGMPPTIVYRAATQNVETIQLKGMPLGSFVNFPYREAEVRLAAGDAVLFMSDGFPELFNEDGDMYGYAEAVTAVERVGAESAQGIIDALVSVCDAWRHNHAPDDDITFVVLKVREPVLSMN